MPKVLSPKQIVDYARDGFAFPVPALTPPEVRTLRGELEAWEQSVGHPIDWPEKSKSYLLFNWADQLVHHPKVLDAVEDLIGPDILVYHTTLFLKEAHQPAFVRWHQDGVYFYLEPRLHVTAWVALSEASIEAGCMQAIPGSHQLGDFEHDDKPDPLNLIKRGQGISDRFDHAQSVHMPIAAGELSLHHTIPTSVKPLGSPTPSALLVRGDDRYRHFIAEERLRDPLSPAAYAAHTEALRRFRARQDNGFVAQTA
jgi:non-haem Fe2+, alpha-ketoglutarate-dependent halogenase